MKTVKYALASVLTAATLLLAACTLIPGSTPTPTPKPDAGPKPVIRGESVVIFGTNNAFSIVYGAEDVSVGGSIAEEIKNTVADLGLKTPEISSDADKTETKCELLIGDTSRALSAEAKAIIDEKVAGDLRGDHWIYLYKDGQLAIYANSEGAYELALAELTEKYYKAGEITVKKDTKSIGYVEGPHDAYMEYEIPDNYYDGYTDPFSVDDKDYKRMTLERLVDGVTYRISYRDENGGVFSQDFVKKEFGMYMMGLISYTERGGRVHNITTSSTEHEFVLRVGAKTPVTIRSGAHGAYPDDKTWQYYEDDTSLYNDRLLDMTFYDAKSGEKIDLDNLGKGIVADGIRIVIHHNIYEMNYKQENVLINSVREYLYNGYDIRFDARLYMVQDVKFSASYSAMLPISKRYGNSAMFYKPDDTTVYMKTPMSGTVNEYRMGVEAYVIDVWGEENPKYHITLTLNNPEHQLMNSVVGQATKGFTGLREMLGGGSNKIYCSFMTASNETLEWGEELHFNTTWTFSIQNDFKNPTREPDFWVGVKK